MALWAAPTAVRDWVSASGTRITASAESVNANIVVLRTADRKVAQVPMEKFSAADIALLQKHFNLAAAGEISQSAVVSVEDSLKWPLGKMAGPIEAAPGSTYYLYLPKQLPKGRKHPLLMVLDPHHGKEASIQRYYAGAERNGWIIITSVESANETDGKSVIPSIDHALANLPIDPERIYLGGFSGGSSRSFRLSKQAKAAGVLACGMGACGAPLDRDLTIYAMAGTQCWNRDNTAASLTALGTKAKNSFMRYFVGKHEWAGSELMDDGITHLNAVFLADHRKVHAEEAWQCEAEILRLAASLKSSNPGRALMWTSFLTDRKVDPRLTAGLDTLHRELLADAAAKKYVDGMIAINQLAIKKIGQNGMEGAKKDLEKLAAEYASTPWGDICRKLQEPSEKSR
jgi:dienelactone hydrolase